MIDKTSELSFNKFYLLEFFDKALAKGSSEIPDQHFHELKSLSGYIVQEENVIPALEKLARYQGLNEFALFLFDMIGRLEDYAPQMIYSTLPDLAEDFISVYSLMLEDEDCREDIKKVLEDFKGHRTDKDGKEEKVAIERSISFEDFYKKEFLIRINEALDQFDESKKANYLAIINSFLQIQKQDETYTNLEFELSIFKILEKLNQILGSETNLPDPDSVVGNLNKKIDELIGLISDLEQNQELFNNIINTGQMPTVKEVEPEPVDTTIVQEEVAEEPTTIDSILQDYFKSEISDHVEAFEYEFNSISADADHNAILLRLLKLVKSLKEISMIHGYVGIEYCSSNLIPVLEKARENKQIFSDQSVEKFKAIISEFENINLFISSKKNDPVIKNVNQLIDGLDKNFLKPKDETKKDKPVEADFGFEDKAKVFALLKDLFGKIHNNIDELHPSIKEETSFNTINDTLGQLQSSTAAVFPSLKQEFLDPLTETYSKLRDWDEQKIEPGLSKINDIWATLLDSLKEPLDLTELKNKFHSFDSLESGQPEEYTYDAPEAIDALLAGFTARWDENKIKILSLIKGEPDAEAEEYTLGANLFREFNSDLKRLDIDSYEPVISFLSDVIAQSISKNYDESLTFEFDKSVDMILDRIRTQGKNGDGEDIHSVLSELFEDKEESIQEPISDVEQEEKPEGLVQDEDAEVEEMFKSEVQQHINRAKDAIHEFERDNNNRGAFSQLENAIHSIKSSAHLLNKDKFSQLATPIEAFAEIYSDPKMALPPNLGNLLKNSIQVMSELLEDPDKQITETIDSLQNELDLITIDDKETESEIKPTQEMEPAVAEKPLFAEQEDSDNELLEIFQQEAKSFISIIDQSHTKLAEDNDDATALNQFEYAAHSLKSAAKMLGFREIAQLTDSMEIVAETLKNKEATYSQKINTAVEEAIDGVKRLSQGEQLSSADIARLINNLEVESDDQEDEPAKEPEDSKKEQVADYYVEEASELLNNLNLDLVELEKMPQSDTILAKILRDLHTLKGSSLMLKHERIGELSHRLEDYFEFYKVQRAEIRQDMLVPAFSVLDLIEELLEGIKEGQGEDTAQYTAKLAEIDNKLFMFQNFDYKTDETVEEKPKKPRRGRTSKSASDDENTIKITTSYLDNLVNMATELVVNRTELTSYFTNLKQIVSEIETEKNHINQTESLVDDLIEEKEFDRDRIGEDLPVVEGREDHLGHLSDRFKNILGRVNSISSELNRLSRDFEKNIGRISNISNVLHSDILKVRMVPIENLFNRYPRPIRDMARQLGKRVSLNIVGNETEMDRAMVEALNDPLMHILRNAVDHGIEKEKDRLAAGKEKTGNITLRARQDRNQVVIDIEDDGAGINLEKIREQIVKRNLANKTAVAKLSEAEILDFLFFPAFSTREETNEVSGRGIGLDVVSNQIQKLKGNIRIKTEPNIGTTFSIRVPLTLIISQALMTRNRDQIIAVPLIAVQESILIKNEKIVMDDNRKYFQVRGKLLPYVTIGDLLKFDQEEKDQQEYDTALVLHDAGVSIALGISEILGRQEIVIKSLGSHLQNVEYIAGGTILGSGEIALILDYAAVIRSIELQFFGKVSERTTTAKDESKPKPKPKKAPARRKRTTKPKIKSTRKVTKEMLGRRKARVLIVDDSSSVRNFVGTVIEKMGYKSIKASDGPVALAKMENEIVNLVITDLEMPEMHGFDFISKLRSEDKYDKVPIIILTGQAGKEQKDKGMEIGADAFIGKPFKENDLIDVIAEFIVVSKKK